MNVWHSARGVVLAVAFAAAGAVATAAQSTTGVVANWGDLEVWSRTPSTSELEHGLGLQLNGSTGTILMSFTGRMDRRAMNPRATSLQIVIAPALRSNPNTVRPATLELLVEDGGISKPFLLDLTPSLRVDNPAPGAVVRSAAATVTAADFKRLIAGTTIKGTVFGSDVIFRPDQIKALQDLAIRLKL